jgi:hypothetical protein
MLEKKLVSVPQKIAPHHVTLRTVKANVLIMFVLVLMGELLQIASQRNVILQNVKGNVYKMYAFVPMEEYHLLVKNVQRIVKMMKYALPSEIVLLNVGAEGI